MYSARGERSWVRAGEHAHAEATASRPAPAGSSSQSFLVETGVALDPATDIVAVVKIMVRGALYPGADQFACSDLNSCTKTAGNNITFLIIIFLGAGLYVAVQEALESIATAASFEAGCFSQS